MKTTRTLLSLALLAAFVSHGPAAPLGTAFTYQGRLTADGVPAGGLYEMYFTLYDAVTNGNAIGTSVTVAPVPVSNGVFNVALDFGVDAFTGAGRWLEIALTVFGSDQPVVTLVPRQPITPVPYALHAANAAGLMSSNNAPLDITVNGQRVLRLDPGTGGTPNLIGGASVNGVAPGVLGATIGGGGTSSPGFEATNRVEANFGTISGGLANTIQTGSRDSTISGGGGNRIGSDSGWSAIGGGESNFIEQNARYSVIAGGGLNRAAGYGSVIGGGSLNTVQTNAEHSSIGGGLRNWIAADARFSTIAGGNANTNGREYGTISGGQGNATLGTYASVGAGRDNISSGHAATIGGGEDNRSGGYQATVSGGAGNDSSGDNATVAGGRSNSSSGEGASVGGGANNSCRGEYGTVSGGLFNTNRGSGATIAGGEGNTSSAFYATVNGGWHNAGDGDAATVSGGSSNRSTGIWATIGGGADNVCSGVGATVVGGSYNTSSNRYATVGGGLWNIAGGQYSFAAGRRAQALHDGSFTWADETDADCVSSTNNQFTARASGGVRFFSDAAATTGVELPAGGNAWSVVSDHNAKENFASLDCRDVLDKLSALPVTSWNLKSQPARVRHLGPMAQDFHAAFGVGEDNRHISTSDADGVAFAAIKGLNQKLEAELQCRDIENAGLKQRLTQLEALVHDLTVQAGRVDRR